MTPDDPQPAGPITYVRDKKVRKPGQGSAWFAILAVVGFLGAMVVIALTGGFVRDTVIALACRATACTAGGLATAGWLIVVLPTVAVAVGVLAMRKMSTAAKIGFYAYAVPVGVIATAFIPGRRTSWDEMLNGPGSDQFADGMLWGLAGLGGFVVTAFLASFMTSPRLAPWRQATTIGGLVTTMLVGLALGITGTDKTYFQAADAFPEESWTAAGDTIRRLDLAEQTGCAGALPVDGRGCVLTISGTFSTDDSDAIVELTAVLYTSEEAADAVRATIPAAYDRAKQALVYSAPHTWVLAGKVTHSDQREITDSERGHLLWALKQVTYRFLSVQNGIFVRPTPADGIGPKTP
jgi:hypothetical protein